LTSTRALSLAAGASLGVALGVAATVSEVRHHVIRRWWPTPEPEPEPEAG